MSMFTEILNPFMNVRNKVKQNGVWKDKNVYREEQGLISGVGVDVDPNGSWTMLNSFGRYIILDSLEYGVRSGGFYPLLYVAPSNSSYVDNLFHIIRDSGRSNATPNEILTYGSNYLECKEVEEGWVVKLKERIYLPEGCQIIFKTLSSSPSSVSYKIHYREVFHN